MLSSDNPEAERHQKAGIMSELITPGKVQWHVNPPVRHVNTSALDLYWSYDQEEAVNKLYLHISRQ